jgi:exopolysaccharide biosynthesis polyprenyl glycosylphosphotransferase
MKNNASFAYSFCLVIGDFFALLAAFVGAYLIRVTFSTKVVAQPVHASTYLSLFLLLTPFWILIFGLLGLYNRNIYEKRFSELGRLFMGSFIGMLFVITVDFLSVKPILPAKLVPIYGFILAFLLLVLFRTIARAIRTTLFSYNIGISNVLIIGDTAIAHELARSLHNSKISGYRVVGLVSDNPDTQKQFKDIHVFKDAPHAFKALETKAIHSIVQTELYRDTDRNNEIMDYAQKHHASYRFIPGNTELFVGNIEVDLFRSAVPVITVHQTPLIGWGRIVKRLFDLLVAIPTAILLLPVMLIIAILVKLFGGSGEIIYKQKRLTRYNRVFNNYKFRTFNNKYHGMTPERAFEKMGKPELSKVYRDNGDHLDNDPRISRLGRFLRVTSLDELPQIFNVLKGDLSLVGPRPLIPEELSLYEKRHAILSVKSGLTGLAIVAGRRNISFDERRKLDIYYVQNWTFWMDIVILIKTIRVIFSGEGAL